MAAPFYVQDGLGTGALARVSEFGELITGAVEYDSSSSAELTLVNTAFNLVKARGDAYTVITGLLLTANKDVGVGDARIKVYSSNVSESSREQTELLFTTEMPQKTVLTLLPLRILVEPGLWINAETDDASIFVTMLHYHINKGRVDQNRSGLAP